VRAFAAYAVLPVPAALAPLVALAGRGLLTLQQQEQLAGGCPGPEAQPRSRPVRHRPGLFAYSVRLPGPAGPGDQLIAFLGRHPPLRAAPGPSTA